MYNWILSNESMAFCFRKVKSPVSLETCQLNNMSKPVMADKSTKRQIKTASIFGIFLISIHLQNGRKSAASKPPKHNGIRNSSAKYNPATTKKISISFLIREAESFILKVNEKK